MSEERKGTQEESQEEPLLQAQCHTPEEAPWFWKVFGGAIISIITVLAALVGNSLMNSMSTTRSELLLMITALKDENVGMREKIATMVQVKESLQIRCNDLEKMIKGVDDINKIYKDKITTLESTVKEKAVFSELNIAALKLSDEKLTKDLQEVRDKMLRLDEKIKKDPK